MAKSMLLQALARQNSGRAPKLLQAKYSAMRQSPFVFLRGACLAFYESLPDSQVIARAPRAWCCGDLHFENFGSYKADNRLVYFDINDYDEAALAPCTWDLVRLLTSLLCGAQAYKASGTQAQAAARSCVDAYRQALRVGKPLWVERDTASGMVQDLLGSLKDRTRVDFLDKRTVRHGQQRQLRLDSGKAFAATPEQRACVEQLIAEFAVGQNQPGFYQVLDVAHRIAGTGSLGVPRYVVLIEGKGSPDGNYLLDLKQAGSCSLLPHLQRLGLAQPAWPDEATRVVSAQKLMQAVDHAFLFPVQMQGQAYILRGLQPSEDRVDMSRWGKKLERLQDVSATMGRVLAWDQLRAAGRKGASSADALADFAQEPDWPAELLDLAQTMAKITKRQWQEFCDAKL